MAASVKHQWYLTKYAKFVYGNDFNLDEENIAETLHVPCKGNWKVYTGQNKDLMLSFLESDHFFITHKEIILESFSLVNSSNWIKAVARRDTLLIMIKFKDGSRRFRIQFDNLDEQKDGTAMRKECTSLLNVYFPICDYDSQVGNASNTGEIANIDKLLLSKAQLRKAYAVDVLDDNFKEMIMLCLTDESFPSYVAEVNKIIKTLGK